LNEVNMIFDEVRDAKRRRGHSHSEYLQRRNSRKGIKFNDNH